MPRLFLASVVLALAGADTIESWLQQAFYPALLGILVIASLGLPIPEDIPLIASGVLLKTHPTIGSWHGTIAVALVGIMSGDLVLYTLGRRWAGDLMRHRTVRWLITPERFEYLTSRFHRHGMWMCFVGRFFMGIRAAMCLTAGATRFPYWKFFIADFGGALLSVPFFIVLGFAFAHAIPTLRQYVVTAQGALLVGLGLVVLGVVVYQVRRRKRQILNRLAEPPPAAVAPPSSEPRTGRLPRKLPALGAEE